MVFREIETGQQHDRSAAVWCPSTNGGEWNGPVFAETPYCLEGSMWPNSWIKRGDLRRSVSTGGDESRIQRCRQIPGHIATFSLAASGIAPHVSPIPLP